MICSGAILKPRVLNFTDANLQMSAQGRNVFQCTHIQWDKDQILLKKYPSPILFSFHIGKVQETHFACI